ncbi:MAG: PrsW family glutamic-type intramembrane protease [Gemmatales bacterium]
MPAPQVPTLEDPRPLLPPPASPMQRLEEHRATFTKKETQPAQSVPRLKKVRTLRGSLYMFFLLASIPLFLGILFEDKADVETRLEKTIQALPKAAQVRAKKVYTEYKRDEAGLEEVLQVLPDKKIQGAWLPLYSKWHYYFTGIAAVVYLLLLGILLPKGFSKFHVKVFIAFFTGTAGMALLFLIQSIALSRAAGGGGGLFGLIFALIGIAYNVGDNPDIGFMPLLLANIFGVGLCEELIKALPVFVYFMGRKRIRWHECCAIGMASGLGFGLVEAFTYGQMYHGLFDQMTYWTRFVSCVVSHGVSTAAAALFLHRFQGLVQGEMTWGDAALRMLILISVPMTLHGLYNTFAAKNMDGLALATDLFNFGWLSVMIETARDREGDHTVIETQDPPPPEPAPETKPHIIQTRWTSDIDQQRMGY